MLPLLNNTLLRNAILNNTFLRNAVDAMQHLFGAFKHAIRILFSKKSLQSEFYRRSLASVKMLQFKDPIFVDCGANLGDVTDWAQKHLKNLSQVYAFEPHPVLSLQIKKRFADISNISVHNIALDSTQGEANFVLREPSGLSSLESTSSKEYYFDQGTHEVVTVKKTTLDYFFSDRTNIGQMILKIDCQGSEINILKGAGRLLKEGKIKVLILEVQSAAFAADADDLSSNSEIFSLIFENDFQILAVSAGYQEKNVSIPMEYDIVFVHNSLVSHVFLNEN